MAKAKAGRYDNIPISARTKEGMTLTCDDLQAIGRMLSLQDNVYEDRFDEVMGAIATLHVKLDDLERDIFDHSLELEDHKNRLNNHEERLDELEGKLKFIEP